MTLTVEEGLRAYARMMNTGEVGEFADLMADDFACSSQMVLAEMHSKAAYIEYITGKLRTMATPKNQPFAEMGHWPSDSALPVLSLIGEPCVILAQGNRDNLRCTVVAKVKDGKLSRIDMCVVPPPETAIRSGEYPGLP